MSMCMCSIGGRGDGRPGLFCYPRGLAVRDGLLYVAEERQIQILTCHGEPRSLTLVHPAITLDGICTDGRHVYATDQDAHVIHMLRLSHEVQRMRRVSGTHPWKDAVRATINLRRHDTELPCDLQIVFL
jgi:hypothetical protein